MIWRIDIGMLLMCFGHGCSFQGQAWMDKHPLAVSAATGSVSSTLLWILKDFAFGDTGANLPLDLGCPINDTLPLNFLTGLIAGFFLWPALEILVLGKQWIILSLKAKIGQFGFQGRLYKVL